MHSETIENLSSLLYCRPMLWMLSTRVMYDDRNLMQAEHKSSTLHSAFYTRLLQSRPGIWFRSHPHIWHLDGKHVQPWSASSWNVQCLRKAIRVFFCTLMRDTVSTISAVACPVSQIRLCGPLLSVPACLSDSENSGCPSKESTVMCCGSEAQHEITA